MSETTAMATLKLQLEADSGFESEREYRITVDQWTAVIRILEGIPQQSGDTRRQ